MGNDMTLMQLMKQLREENVSDDERKRRMDAFLTEKAAEKGIPFNGEFELTPLCNLDCRMCYVHLDHDHLGQTQLLTPAIWKELFREAQKAGMAKACLSGGECLTYPGFEELYLDLKQAGV